MAKAAIQTTIRPHLSVSKRTSIGSGKPQNKAKRRSWKAYRGQGRA